MNNSLVNLKRYFSSPTGKLALTYLMIIMALTIIFSAIIYIIAADQLDRPLPPQFEGRGGLVQRDQFREIIEQRANQARSMLLITMAILNSVVLVLGALFSHFMARKTLRPIEKAMDAQNQFVSDASHELRTPLTALQTTNEVALRKKKLSLTEAKELIGYNVIEVVKLRELTNSLLGLVKQESATINKQSFFVHEVVSEVSQKFIASAQAKDIEVDDRTSDIAIYANKPAVDQIMTIFIDNAIKYSPEKSKITLHTQETNDEVRLSVQDEGEGISKNQQSKVFDRFYRVDQSRSGSNTEGTGLGLAIAKAICDRQGMKVSLASENKGSKFTLHIKK